MSDNPLKPKIIASPLNPTGEPPNNDTAAGLARVKLAEEIEWLNRLSGNTDFQRFVAIIKVDSLASRKRLRDPDDIVTLTTEQRAAYGQKLAMQLDIADWTIDRLSFCLATVKALDEQRKVQS